MKVLDLFSGIGGFSLGLERAGMETVAFCEIAPFCQKVLAKHWPGVPIYDDVREVTAERLRADGIFPNVITGGFPCQDLSFAGNQEGIDAERSGLWSELARIIGDLRPRYAIIENVTALISGERGRWFARVLADLAAVGFDAEWHCLPGYFVSAPQSRDRVWIIAYPASNTAQKLQMVGQVISAGKVHGELGRVGREVWAGWDADKCPLVGVAYGVSGALHGTGTWGDRTKSLGNTVIPQIPELIGRAIMEIENG